MKVYWSKSSIRDLENIHAYIAADSTTYANRFIARLIHSVEAAESFPKSGRKVPEIQDDALREFLVENYRVIYRIEKDQIFVITVVHAARDLSRLEDKPWEAE